MNALSFVAVLFVALIFVNLFIRVKVLKYYKILIANRIEFDVKDLLDIEKIKNEVVPRYPNHEDSILSFVKNLRVSILLVFAIIVLVVVFWSILYTGR